MEQQEFLRLINPFRNKIFRVAKRLLVSIEEAEDATQEVFLKLWSKNEGLKEYRSVEALAMTMTKNYCLDQLRSKRSGNVSLETQFHVRDSEASVQKNVEARDGLKWIAKAMERLPEQQKMIMQLRDIEEYDYAEISEIMEMNETAIRVALSRARKNIREYMTKTYEYGLS